MKLFELIRHLQRFNLDSDVRFVGKSWKETELKKEDVECVMQGGQDPKPVIMIYTPEGRGK